VVVHDDQEAAVRRYEVLEARAVDGRPEGPADDLPFVADLELPGCQDLDIPLDLDLDGLAAVWYPISR